MYISILLIIILEVCLQSTDAIISNSVSLTTTGILSTTDLPTSIPSTTLPTASLPNTTTLVSTSLPNATTLVTTSLPNATTLVSTSLPNTTTLVSTSLPNTTTLVTTSLPNATTLVTTSLPNATTLISTSLPNSTTLVSTSLPNSTSTTHFPNTFTTTIAPSNGTDQIIADIKNQVELINSSSITEDFIMNITQQFESLISTIDVMTAQDSMVAESVVFLASDIINVILVESPANSSSTDPNQIPPTLVSVILTLENFVNTVAQGLSVNSTQETLISERVQVYIEGVEVMTQESDITIPNRNSINNQLSPIAFVPLSVLKQVAGQNNVDSFLTSSITYDLSPIIDEADITGLISINFHLPNTVSNLLQPINISFPHNFQFELAQPMCISFNETNGTNSNGLELVNVNDSTIVCATTHLTTFAAIVRFNRPVGRAEDLASKVTSFVLLSFSFVALSISLMLFCFAGKKFFKSLPNLIYFNYAIALTLGCGSFIFLLPTAVLNNHYCVIASLVTQYAWIAVFTWSFCIGIVMVQFFKEEKIRNQLRCFIVYFLFGWGFPILPCIVTLVASIPDITTNYVHYESMVQNSTCFLSSEAPAYSTWGMLCPIILLLSLNALALTYLTMKLCWRIKPHKMPFAQISSSRSDFYQQYRALYVQFLVLISILGLPWFFLVVNIICSYLIGLNELTSIMEWLFLLLNAPIGVVFFFAYTIRVMAVKELFATDPTFTVFSSQQAVVYHSAKENVDLPARIPRPRKTKKISSEYTSV